MYYDKYDTNNLVKQKGTGMHLLPKGVVHYKEDQYPVLSTC